jgi:hypothetical protein
MSVPRISFTRSIAALSLFCWIATPTTAFAAEPRFDEIILSGEKDGKKADVPFKVDAPTIFLRAQMLDVPTNSKISCVWVAVQAQGAPANFVIDSVHETARTVFGIATNVFNCSLSKPRDGWPTGSYRVDLLVDDKKTNEAVFAVKSETVVVAAAPAPVQARQDFTLVNKTGYDIREVYISPADASDWEDDVLGDDELLDDDDQVIRFKRAEKTCKWDLKVVYSEDDSEAIWYAVDLCKVAQITIKYNNKTGKTSATFD